MPPCPHCDFTDSWLQGYEHHFVAVHPGSPEAAAVLMDRAIQAMPPGLVRKMWA